jgi:enterochelin esterase family protein
LYWPPGLVAGTALPLLVVLDGEIWVENQDWATTLDNLIVDGRVRPCWGVFVDSGGRERRWQELGADGAGLAWLADRLVPWVWEECPVSRSARDVVVAGQSLGALTALRAVIERPDRFGGAISQSASLWQVRPEELLAGCDVSTARFYIEVGTHEWVLKDPNARLAALLEGRAAEVRFAPYNGGHDYACWRCGLAQGVAALLG